MSVESPSAMAARPAISHAGAAPQRSLWIATELACATLLLHFLTNRGYGYFRDEFYYIACSRHLDWGYVDHPPGIAFVTWLEMHLFGDSRFALRLLPAVAHALLVWLTVVMARRLGGGRMAQALAGVAVLVGPVFLSGGTLLTMNAFEQLLWPVCAFALAVALRGDSARAWVGFGIAAGIALMNKHSTGFFLMALAAALLLTPERRVLRTRWPWIAVGLAVLLVAPNVIWQMRHDWPTLEFLRNAAARKNYPVSPVEFLKAQILLVHPFTLPLWLAGLWFFLRDRRARGLRVLGWAFVLLFVLFLAIKAKHYYLSPAYPMLMAGGSVWVADRLAGRRGRRIFVAALVVLLVGGALLAPYTLPVLPRETFVRYSNWLGIHEPPAERHRPAKLPQTFADMFGWEEMTAEVARVYRSLSPAEQARCTIFASNYGEAGAIDFFGPKYRLPKATCGHNSYWLWGPPNPDADIVITVGEDFEDVQKACNRVVGVGVFRHEWNMPYESDLPILIGRDFKLGWRAMWPETKEYI